MTSSEDPSLPGRRHLEQTSHGVQGLPESTSKRG